MDITAGLNIDFGNSETRVVLLTNKRAYQFNLSNRYASVGLDYHPNKKYAETNDKKKPESTMFTLVDYDEEQKPIIKLFANGYIAEQEFGSVLMSPSPNKGKTEQLTTVLTLNLVIIKALTILSASEGVPMAQLNVTFNVSVLLPPRDHKAKEEVMRNIIRSCNVVRSVLPYRFERTFNIDKVEVYSESVAAFFGAMFQELNGRYIESNEGLSLVDGHIIELDRNDDMYIDLVPENEKFQEGYVLVIDIGAGTSDVALFKDIELIENSRETFDKGGKLVEASLQALIEEREGYRPKESPLILAEAQFREGLDYVDVSDLVIKAKQNYSIQMKNWLEGYINRMSINMRDVSGVLIVGGGALPSVRDGKVVAPAMSDILVDYLRELAPRVKMLHLEGKNLRYLNIDGLKYLHKYSV